MRTEKELGEALKRGDDHIEIEFDLKNKVLKIISTGKICWAVCATSITVAIAAVIISLSSGGASTPVTAPTAVASLGVSATVLGVSTATSAVMIGSYGGGISALNKLRKYRIEKVNDDKIILHKK